MNWDALGAIAELIGAVGVVASFVYLAGQIRHNSRSVEAATYHSTMLARNQLNFAHATSPELSALLVRAGDDATTLSAEESVRFNAYMWGLTNLFEDSLFQYTKGLLTRENWMSTRWALLEVLSQPGSREWMKHTMPGFSESLQKEIGSVLSQGEDGI